ncbi:patatin-like phospholipase family protein [Robiginitalea myxolifaciens]|nr:patatin-like phospholipase family protein [Robiginitalea myxolifaciens]
MRNRPDGRIVESIKGKMQGNWPDKKQCGLILSGGGVRGMAHIGILEVLKEYELQPHWVSGSSVGALIGALYAQDASSKEMLAFFKNTPLFRYSFFSLSKPGLLNTDRYFDLFKAQWPENSFESLRRPLYVAATDLLNGDVVYFHQGELIPALLASAALPPIFSPVQIGKGLYADGGIMDNFPRSPLEEHVEFLVGSNVSVIETVEKKAISSSFQLTNRTTSLMLYAINKERIIKSDLLFEPLNLEKINVLDKAGIEKAYQIGKDYARKVMDDYLKDQAS